MRFTILAVVLLMALPAFGQETPTMIIDIGESQPGTYLVTVNADGTVGVRKVSQVLRLGDGTNPPPPPPPPGDVKTQVRSWFRDLVTDPTKNQTAIAVAKVYETVAGFARQGTINKVSLMKLTTRSTVETALSQTDKLEFWEPFLEKVNGLTDSIADGDVAKGIEVWTAIAEVLSENAVDGSKLEFKREESIIGMTTEAVRVVTRVDRESERMVRFDNRVKLLAAVH